MLLPIIAAATAAAAALPTPTVVSPLTVTAQPKTAPPADVTLSMDSSDEAAGGQRVTIWPTHALNRSADGRVTLTCLIDVHGLAEHCRVAFEHPQGMGFGAAALELQPTLKLTPAKGPDGQPVAREMNIALNFKAPDMETDLQQFESALGSGHAANVSVQHQPLPMRHVVMMNHPVWIEAPSFGDLEKAYPARAGGVEGYAVAHCEVDRASGALRRCITAKELPAALGFAPAALKLAVRFKVSPEVMQYAPHGDPIEVDIPIRFTPPGAAERTVSAPSWISGVDPESTLKLFPPEAAAKGVTSGRGEAKCEVAADGALKNCAPEGAEPDGMGFSEAAVKLASTLRMNLWSADAAPVQGGVIHVAFRMNLQPTSR
jgi:hypothetical protein